MAFTTKEKAVLAQLAYQEVDVAQNKKT